MAHLPLTALGMGEVLVKGDRPQAKTAFHFSHSCLPEDVLAVGGWRSPREAQVIHVVGIDAHGGSALN
jgi:hypothetical protein